ncbi:hypothetical protein [Salipiger sp.]|uniref:hypothetical protein n=1 Tax=Salipiger sp. TaxID=2078585 RepID=UPI003A97C11F
MTAIDLPTGTAEVLDIPDRNMPDVFSALIAERRLSRLVATIHGDLWSGNPGLRQRSRLALRKLGFTD